MLFGHHNNDVNQPAPDPTPPMQVSPTLNPLAVDPSTGVSLPVASDPINGDPVVAPEPSALNQPVAPEPSFAGMALPPPPAPMTPPPAPTTAPLPLNMPEPAALDPVPEPVSAPVPEALAAPEPVVPPVPEPAAAPEPEPVMPDPAPEPPAEEPVMPLDEPEAAAEPEPQTFESAGEPVDTDDLLDLKQHALAELTPLVDKLDQTPEERFRTKMMMIQSTDDQTLIKDAYEAAMAITDEKNRAQALLDIVNEINYFTAPSQNNQ